MNATSHLGSAEDQDACELLVRGCAKGASEREQLADARRIERFFRRIDTEYLERLLADFEISEDTEIRKARGQILAAYFDWCHRNGRKLLPASKEGLGIWAWSPFREDRPRVDEFMPVDGYLLRFAQVVIARMTGSFDGVVYEKTYERLPVWNTPDVALAWRRRRGRPRTTNNKTEIAICAFVLRLRRRGVPPGKTNERAASKFACSVSKVEKALRIMDLEGYRLVSAGEWKPLVEMTEAELDEVVRLLRST